MTSARKIVEMFGGQRRLADLLGHKNQSTVHGWCVRGVIPLRQIAAVMKAGRRLGLQISAEDFLPATTKKAS